MLVVLGTDITFSIDAEVFRTMHEIAKTASIAENELKVG